MKVPIIDIDEKSGFCFGVVIAIQKAESELSADGQLYCLGDIVHNSSEVERLRLKGLETISHGRLAELSDAKVLLRAHGEPPSTYEVARSNNIEIIDATCPVVLALQRRIKDAYTAPVVEGGEPPLILIYGKRGHAEVNGLVGQTNGTAVVIESVDELDRIDLDRDIMLYSQTTKSLEGFATIVEAIKSRKRKGIFRYYDTICRQVASRMDDIRAFAAAHEVVLFVSGSKSSNGKVLFAECCKVNNRSFQISSESEIQEEWLAGAATIGICGATSTPRWLMNDVKNHVAALFNI